MTGPAYTYQATITRWVDGDTVDLAVDAGFHVTINGRFRLHGVNTPERGRPGWAEATAYAVALAPPGTAVTVRTYQAHEKYGRFLADVHTPAGVWVNQALLGAGHATPYPG